MREPQELALVALDEAIEKRKLLIEQQDEINALIRLRVYEARQVGVPIKAIRAMLGISSQRVHQMVKQVTLDKMIERENSDREFRFRSIHKQYLDDFNAELLKREPK